jgi:hypothetical protein
MNGNCPIKGDYRLFTDWRPRCAQQYWNMIEDNLPSSLDQRMYLTHNANELMSKNAKDAYLKANCGPCFDNPTWNDGTMLREFDTQKCNLRTCSFSLNDASGLGRQRFYAPQGDLDKAFIAEKEKEQALWKAKGQLNVKPSDAWMPLDPNSQAQYRERQSRANTSVPTGFNL